MVTIPLGQQAYRRDFAGMPDIRLENRFAEKDPSNLREHVALIARAGTNTVARCTGGVNRGNCSKEGMFNGDLFVVAGHNFWRVDKTGTATQITGTVAGDGFVYVTWMKGIGYEYLFISDGATLQYFSEHAFGTWTLTGNVQEGMVLKIGTTYIGWSATVDHGSPAGTVTNPYWALLASGGVDTAANNAQSLANMVTALGAAGVAGADYSTTITAPNADVTATSDDTHLVVTAIVNTTAGNSIATTTPVDGSGSGAWGATTLAGGGGTTLRTVTGLSGGEVPKALATLDGFVLVSVGNSQKFYIIFPGETEIDDTVYAEKESNPDNILDMTVSGDQVLISGDASAEWWAATGDLNNPFAPVEGRALARGVVEGTAVAVNEGVIYVGNNGRVYNTSAGPEPISTPAIAERIRTQLRREGLLPP